MYSWPAEVADEGCLNFIFELMVMIFSGVDVEIFSSVIRWKFVEERFVAQDADIDIAVLTHVDAISIGPLQKDFNVAMVQVIAFRNSFTNCTDGVSERSVSVACGPFAQLANVFSQFRAIV